MSELDDIRFECTVCRKAEGKRIKIDATVRNVCGLKFEYLHSYAHPECIGLEMCPNCRNHYIKKKVCTHTVNLDSIPTFSVETIN